jgi:hypothetical protein
MCRHSERSQRRRGRVRPTTPTLRRADAQRRSNPLAPTVTFAPTMRERVFDPLQIDDDEREQVPEFFTSSQLGKDADRVGVGRFLMGFLILILILIFLIFFFDLLPDFYLK